MWFDMKNEKSSKVRLITAVTMLQVTGENADNNVDPTDNKKKIVKYGKI